MIEEIHDHILAGDGAEPHSRAEPRRDLNAIRQKYVEGDGAENPMAIAVVAGNLATLIGESNGKKGETDSESVELGTYEHG